MRPPPKPKPPSSNQLWLTGCVGAIVGTMLSACGLGLLGLFAAFGSAKPLSLPPPDPAQPEMIITVQEAFFGQMLAQALPFGQASKLSLDVQPGNRLVFAGRIKTVIFGQAIESDISAVITLNARDGKLVIEIQDVNVSGFGLGGIGDSLLQDVSSRISGMIDDQVKAGLGEGAYIMSVTTDDHQLILQARWP